MVEEVFSRDRANAYSFMWEHPNLAELERERYRVRTYDYLTRSERAFRGGDRTVEGMRSGQFLAGDPDSLAEQILEQRKVTGAGVLVIRPEMGNTPLDEVAAGLELFAREVLPVVHKA